MPTSSPSAGQFAKQSAYNSGYSGYDPLSQTPSDYSKTAYQSAAQQAKSHSSANQAGSNSELSTSMYNKSHVKVNVSYRFPCQLFTSVFLIICLVIRQTIVPFWHTASI